MVATGDGTPARVPGVSTGLGRLDQPGAQLARCDAGAAGPRQTEADSPNGRSRPGPGTAGTLAVVPVSSFRAASVERGQVSSIGFARLDRTVREAGCHNLPLSVTGFIGRTREIAEARRLLGTTRLLTLTGTGGVGKTRLGHEVAAGLLDDFEGGVWLVELASLADPTLVPQAVAGVLGVREDPERPLPASLVDAIQPRQLLLVLDNCDHLVEACAELSATLLRACPELWILATSRQALGIGGETTLRVPSLALSAVSDAGAASLLGEDEIDDVVVCPDSSPGRIEGQGVSEAVQLFVERARAVAPAFTLTGRNATTVEQICRRLDGIPLAIELAAARVAVLTPEQIAARLGDRFRLLTGGSRTVLPRYRTLRALVDWSHDLLDEQERTLLRRLAVFAGGWTLEAAEAVCAGDGLNSDEILDLLSGLVAKSLVLADQHAEEARYRFLESLREYAGEKLRAACEEVTLAERHRDWFLALAERAEPELNGADSVKWLDQLERNRENVRATLGWCIERGEAESGLRLAGALARFFLVRGPYHETRGTLTALLASASADDGAPTTLAARAKALSSAGMLAMRQGDCAAADIYYSEALTISRQLGDRRGLAIVQFSIGHLARVRGDYLDARRQIEDSRRLFQELGDRHWQARAHQELGAATYFQGDLAGARAHYEASLALFRDLGDELGMACSLNDLGEVALLRGDLERARALLAASLAIARRADDKERIAMALAALAGLTAAQSQPARALRLAAAALALNEATGQRNSPAWHALVERWLEPARRALHPEACAAAQATGRAMSLDVAIEYALTTDVAASAPWEGDAVQPDVSAGRAHSPVASGCGDRPAGSSASGPSRVSNVLTQRELEVAALVARGLTNRRIADELVITPGTATNHVKHILAKLGVDSRVQIAAWAIGRGLYQPSLA